MLCSDLFEKFKKYNVPVYKARHPQLSSYVAEVVRSAMENIVKVCLFTIALICRADNGTGTSEKATCGHQRCNDG